MTTPRILIVDDEPMNRCLLEAILASEGYEVIEARDGAECLELVQSSPIDLVLLDVMMPRMTGFEACVRIRNDLDRHDLPIIFVTALGDREARIHGKDVGADEFLTKPIDDVELLVRVRSLLRIKSQHDAREKQRRLMSAILDAMTEGVVATDGATGFTLWNSAAEHILGARDGWQQPASWQDQAVGEPLALALTGVATTERKVRHGSSMLSVNARPLVADRGVPGAVGVFRDITELVALDQFKHEMTSLVVHDLKNVMQVIVSNVELALDEVDASSELDAMLHDAKDGASRALRLIANLMDVSRLENRALPLNLESLDIDGLCRAATRHRSAQLRAKQIALEIRSPGAACAMGDSELVQRVLDNVLDNAVRYTPCGGRIVLAVTPAGDRVRIAIGNTGTPIPAEHRHHIFEKYGRSTQLGDKRGLNAGLGLYFCRLAIAAHGGSIRIESTPELPTVFVIELSVTPAQVEAA